MMKTILNGPEHLKICTPLQEKKTEKIEKNKTGIKKEERNQANKPAHK